MPPRSGSRERNKANCYFSKWLKYKVWWLHIRETKENTALMLLSAFYCELPLKRHSELPLAFSLIFSLLVNENLYK